MITRRLAQTGREPDDSRGAIDHTPTTAEAAAVFRTGLDPGGWTGGVWFAPGKGGSWHWSTSCWASASCCFVSGSRGNRPLGQAPSAEVKSPTVWRRQAVMLGLTTPVTSSSSRVTEVWSNVSWQTKPPTVHGEMRMQGTRNPRPMGPGAGFSADADEVMYSPAVPAGAVGGRK